MTALATPMLVAALPASARYVDMRARVRQRIAGGERLDAIRRWLVVPCGDPVSYGPRFTALTAPSWLAPVLLIRGAGVTRASFCRKRY